VGLAVTVLQLLLTEVRLKLYSLRHNASLYTRTWYNANPSVRIHQNPKEQRNGRKRGRPRPVAGTLS
jgi:hypothetical protein